MIEPTQLPLIVQSGTTNTTNHRATSWFEAMAEAWGEALDQQADTIIEQSQSLTDGDESASAITLLTAESLRMQFLSNSSHTALTAVGSALETMARKQ